MTRILMCLAALVAACCLLLGTARADEKAAPKKDECRYCHALKHVTESMRCDACKTADKACEKCAAAAKKVADIAKCPPCADRKGDTAACGMCAAAAKGDEHCEFCADKKMVAERMYCCGDCAAAKKTDCPGCTKARDKIMAITCAKCADGHGKADGHK